jgi:hypothetical protein
LLSAGLDKHLIKLIKQKMSTTQQKPTTKPNKLKSTSQKVPNDPHQGKSKKSRRERLREKALARLDQGEGEVSSSRRIMSSFDENLNFRHSDVARILYEHALADPENATPCGVYREDDYTHKSLKMILRGTSSTLITSNQSSFIWSFFNCSSPNNSSNNEISEDHDGLPDQKTAAWLQNTLPKYLQGSTTITPYFAPATGMYIPDNLSGGFPAKTPALGVQVAYDAENIYWPEALGVDLENAQGRIVGLQYRVYCTSEILTRAGTGMIFQGINPSSASLNDRTIDEIYQTQGIEVQLAPLAKIGDGDVFVANRIPGDRDDTNWCQMDWRSSSIPDPTLIGRNATNVWGGFAAWDLTPGMAFRIEYSVMLEVRSAAYSFATINVPSTGEDVTPYAGQVLKPSLLHMPSLAMASTDAEESNEANDARSAGLLNHAETSIMGPITGQQLLAGVASGAENHSSGSTLAKVAKSAAEGAATAADVVSGVASAGEIIGDILGGLGAVFGLATKIPTHELLTHHPKVNLPSRRFRGVSPPRKSVPTRESEPETTPCEDCRDHMPSVGNSPNVKRFGGSPSETAPLKPLKEGFEEKVRIVLDIEECPSCNCLH